MTEGQSVELIKAVVMLPKVRCQNVPLRGFRAGLVDVRFFAKFCKNEGPADSEVPLGGRFLLENWRDEWNVRGHRRWVC
jgi:hypothetical protein